jgi:hypothetical protein
MYFTCTKSNVNIKLIDNLIVWLGTSTICGEICWLT